MPTKQKAAKKKDIVAKGSNPPADGSAPTDWPAMKPTTPADDLTLEILLADQVLTIPKLWTASLCKTYVSFLSSLPLTTTPGKPKRGEAVRVNDRFQVDDVEFAARLWSETALQQMVENPVIDGRQLSPEERDSMWGGEVLGLNSNIRIYRYGKGQFFDQHYDESNRVTFPSATSSATVAARTTWTLLLYLTSASTGCKGGETVFYPEPHSKRDPAPPPVVAELDVGMALLHKHGNDCLLHEGREVREGEKWVIRSDLCVKR